MTTKQERRCPRCGCGPCPGCGGCECDCRCWTPLTWAWYRVIVTDPLACDEPK